MDLDNENVLACLRRMAKGDVSALEEIYKSFQRQIFVTALKKLHGDRPAAEDVVHQTFEALILDPAGYEPSKGPFLAWLQGIAHYKVMDHFRMSGKTDHIDEENNNEEIASESGKDDPADIVDEKTRHQALMRCMDKLPYEQRDAVISGWLREMTYVDVAKMLHTEVGTIKSRIHNALKRLRNCLEKQLGARAFS